MSRPDYEKPLSRSPHRPYVSRDYEIDIVECDATHCPVNRRNSCSMPSAIKLGADMKCKTGERLFALKQPTTPQPLDGD